MDNFLHHEVSPNRIPIEAFWDQQDARLLAVETEYAKLDTEDKNKKDEEKKDVTPDNNAVKDNEADDEFR